MDDDAWSDLLDFDFKDLALSGLLIFLIS